MSNTNNATQTNEATPAPALLWSIVERDKQYGEVLPWAGLFPTKEAAIAAVEERRLKLYEYDEEGLKLYEPLGWHKPESCKAGCKAGCTIWSDDENYPGVEGEYCLVGHKMA